MEKRTKNLILVIIMLLFIFIWTLLLIIIGSKEIVSFIGVEESHLIIFLLAVFGALTSLTTFSIYPIIGTFVAGGINPL